jgi:hypothetical protein
MMQDRFAAAEELNWQALGLSERAPDAKLIENAATCSGDSSTNAAAARRSKASPTDSRLPLLATPLALMHLAAGKPEAARAEVEQFATSGFGRLQRDANRLATMTLLAGSAPRSARRAGHRILRAARPPTASVAS